MIPLFPCLDGGPRPLRVLCLGAHCDDIEIGCGGTLLRLREWNPDVEIRWHVFSGEEPRGSETRRSLVHFGVAPTEEGIRIESFRDGYLPWEGARVKEALHSTWPDFVPDLVFTHYRQDRHQDHRLISDLTWNAYRDHLVLEYEIPKWDGDLGSPNLFVPLDVATVERKLSILEGEYASQRDKPAFDLGAFRGLMALRGVESKLPGGFAEAFHVRKILFSPRES